MFYQPSSARAAQALQSSVDRPSARAADGPGGVRGQWPSGRERGSGPAQAAAQAQVTARVAQQRPVGRERPRAQQRPSRDAFLQKTPSTFVQSPEPNLHYSNESSTSQKTPCVFLFLGFLTFSPSFFLGTEDGTGGTGRRSIPAGAGTATAKTGHGTMAGPAMHAGTGGMARGGPQRAGHARVRQPRGDGGAARLR